MSNYPKTLSAGVAACNPPSRTVMPENMTELTYEEVRQAWDAFNQSEIAHPINQLNHVLERGAALSQWEIDQVNKVFEKFNAKYNSPLAKALK